MQFCSETREYMCLVCTCKKWRRCLFLYLPLREVCIVLCVAMFKHLSREVWEDPRSVNFQVLHSSLGCFEVNLGVGQLVNPRLALIFMLSISTQEQRCQCVRLGTAGVCVSFPVLLSDVAGANVFLPDSHSHDGSTDKHF